VSYIVHVDAAQGQIVAALRDAGRPVRLMHEVGRGFPDLLTMHIDGRLILIEVKTGKGYTKPKTKALQDAFARVWPVAQCTTPEEALRAVGLLR
jgi:hypothetical protein